MLELSDFLHEHLLIEYSSRHQSLYCIINRIEDDNIHLSTSQDFEKSGLLPDDIVKCRITREQSEYFFDAKILNMQKGLEGLNLIIKPITELEEFLNLRSEERIYAKFIAFTDQDIMASVNNISKSGISISTTANYEKSDTINLKLVAPYPHIECTLKGIIVRINEISENKNEYGIQIEDFGSDKEAEKYEELVNSISDMLFSL